MPYKAAGKQVKVKRNSKWETLSNEKSTDAAKRKAAKLNIEHKKGKYA